MSYDLRIAVKVDGTDIFVQIAEPEWEEKYNDEIRAVPDPNRRNKA